MKPMPLHTPINILLADDDADDRYFFEKALGVIPFTTKLKTVPDGEQLMNYLLANTENLPDILFLDNNMPRKTGYECLIEIKKNEQLKRIPVIICSTSLGDDFANKFYKNEAHYYLHKCAFSELTKSIEKIFNMLAKNPGQPSQDKFMLSLQEA